MSDDIGESVAGIIVLGVIGSPVVGFLAYFAFKLAKFGWWLAELLAVFVVGLFSAQPHRLFGG